MATALHFSPYFCCSPPLRFVCDVTVPKNPVHPWKPWVIHDCMLLTQSNFSLMRWTRGHFVLLQLQAMRTLACRVYTQSRGWRVVTESRLKQIILLMEMYVLLLEDKEKFCGMLLSAIWAASGSNCGKWQVEIILLPRGMIFMLPGTLSSREVSLGLVNSVKNVVLGSDGHWLHCSSIMVWQWCQWVGVIAETLLKFQYICWDTMY